MTVQIICWSVTTRPSLLEPTLISLLGDHAQTISIHEMIIGLVVGVLSTCINKYDKYAIFIFICIIIYVINFAYITGLTKLLAKNSSLTPTMHD